MKLFGDSESAVGGAVVDDDEFPVKFPVAGGESVSPLVTTSETGGSVYFSVKVRFSSQVMMGRLRRSLYVAEVAECKSSNAGSDGEGRLTQNYRVLVLDGHGVPRDARYKECESCKSRCLLQRELWLR